MIRGEPGGRGFDLVATAIGTVALDRVLDGSAVCPATSSSGSRAAACTRMATPWRAARCSTAAVSARRPCRRAGMHPGGRAATADAYLRSPILAVLDAGLPVHALAHITGDGLFNLVRTARPWASTSNVAEPPPIFELVQRLGDVAARRCSAPSTWASGSAWSWRRRAQTELGELLAGAGLAVHVLGRATDDAERTVSLRPASGCRAGRFACRFRHA